jgi:hypothetical protein
MNKKLLIKKFAIIFLIVLCGYFLYKVLHHPYMTIIVKYKEVPPVVQGFPREKIDAYYRGYYVGTVSKIRLSNDQQHVLFYLDIYCKDLRLSKDVRIFLNSEDIYGAKHLSIYLPKKTSTGLLSDGETIDGAGFYDRLDSYLVRDLSTGKTGRLISNLVVITDFLKNSMESSDSKKFMADLKASGLDIGLVLKDFRDIIGDPQIKQSIKSSTVSIAQILESKGLRDTIDNAPVSIDKTLTNLGSINKNLITSNSLLENSTSKLVKSNSLLSNSTSSLEKSNSLLRNSTSSLIKSNSLLRNSTSSLEKSNSLVINSTSKLETSNSLMSKTNSNLEAVNNKVSPELLKNADKTLKTANCLVSESIDILSKRFLILRFIFGSPASSLKKCKNGNCTK